MLIKNNYLKKKYLKVIFKSYLKNKLLLEFFGQPLEREPLRTYTSSSLIYNLGFKCIFLYTHSKTFNTHLNINNLGFRSHFTIVKLFKTVNRQWYVLYFLQVSFEKP